MWLEEAGHRVATEKTSERKIRLTCQCGWQVGCRNMNEQLWRNTHWRHVLRMWD